MRTIAEIVNPRQDESFAETARRKAWERVEERAPSDGRMAAICACYEALAVAHDYRVEEATELRAEVARLRAQVRKREGGAP